MFGEELDARRSYDAGSEDTDTFAEQGTLGVGDMEADKMHE